MFVVLILGLLLSIAILQSGPELATRHRAPASEQPSQARAERFHIFSKSAEHYVLGKPAVVGDVSWEQIMTAPTTAPAWRHIQMPAEWKIIADGEGGYTLCASLDERSASHAGNNAPMPVNAPPC